MSALAEPSSANASHALAVREAVQQLVQATQKGNLASFKQSYKVMGENAEAVRAIRDEYGRSLLHHAAQTGHTKIVQHLLDNLGFDKDAKDDKGDTPLALAAATGQTEVVQQLIKAGAALDVAVNPETGRGPASALHRAASLSDTRPLQLLREAGADKGARCETGTPLCWAASAGQEAAVKLLLKQGADPNATTPQDLSALCMAAGACSVPCVRALLAGGAAPQLPNRGGTTPLHIAAAMGGDRGAERSCEIIKLLLEAGADPNAADEEGQVPVQLAAASGRGRVVRALLGVTRPVPGVEPWDEAGLLRAAEERAKRQAAEAAAVSSRVESSGEGSGLRVAIPEASEPDADKAAARKREGDEAFVKQDYDAAAVAYSASLQHDTKNAVVWANRAAAYLRLGKPAEALRDARTARALDPKYAKAWYREGSAHAMMEEWEEAANAYFEGCQLAPGNREFEAAFKSAIESGKQAHQAKVAGKA